MNSLRGCVMLSSPAYSVFMLIWTQTSPSSLFPVPTWLFSQSANQTPGKPNAWPTYPVILCYVYPAYMLSLTPLSLPLSGFRGGSMLFIKESQVSPELKRNTSTLTLVCLRLFGRCHHSFLSLFVCQLSCNTAKSEDAIACYRLLWSRGCQVKHLVASEQFIVVTLYRFEKIKSGLWGLHVNILSSVCVFVQWN